MSGGRTVLLTVSGVIPADLDEQIAAGRRPRADYVEMAGAFDADVLDFAGAQAAAGRVARLVGRLAGPASVLAWVAFRRRDRYRAVFTDGEQVGLPYATLTRLLRRRPRHVMIGHLLTTRSKRIVHRGLRLDKTIDAVVVYSSPQRDFATSELGYPRERVLLRPFMVDTGFWRPELAGPSDRERRLICAVGQELRDYPTFARAVDGLDADVVIAAASPWSRRTDSSAGLHVPDNVHVGGYDLFELRELYAHADLVVVPLQETDFQAGITSILEAMAMGRAVVCTRTSGQQDTIVDGETGVYVPPGDAGALRRAIDRLLADDALRSDIGGRARRWVQEHADIETYAEELGALVRA